VDKSTVAEHSTESGHWIKLQVTKVVAKTWGDMDRFVRGNRNKDYAQTISTERKDSNWAKNGNPAPNY
jgi:hypothetical protein